MTTLDAMAKKKAEASAEQRARAGREVAVELERIRSSGVQSCWVSEHSPALPPPIRIGWGRGHRDETGRRHRAEDVGVSAGHSAGTGTGAREFPGPTSAQLVVGGAPLNRSARNCAAWTWKRANAAAWS